MKKPKILNTKAKYKKINGPTRRMRFLVIRRPTVTVLFIRANVIFLPETTPESQ